jgi:hypothetical protein
MSSVVELCESRLFVAYTDWRWATTQMGRVNEDLAVFARPTLTPFRALKSGERFVFKAARDQIADGPILGDARFVEYMEMSASLAWRIFNKGVGHASLKAWLSNLAKYAGSGSPTVQDPEAKKSLIVLEKLRFLEPINWLPEPMDWKHGTQVGKTYSEAAGEGRELALALDHILGPFNLKHAA